VNVTKQTLFWQRKHYWTIGIIALNPTFFLYKNKTMFYISFAFSQDKPKYAAFSGKTN
jgi:hypothetical protein